MYGFVPEIMQMASTNNETVILMLDQSKISNGFECLMVSMRVSDRAMPVAWKEIQTNGAIGFDIQKQLLDDVAKMVPEGINIMLAGDRFYGTHALIEWCLQHEWKYCIRLNQI